VDNHEIDLASLRALEALLLERHVSRAARRVHISQPAMSRTLQRLRGAFEDELLIRTAGRYELTERASRLLPRVRRVLDELRALQQPQEFTPARTTDQITVAGLDIELEEFAPSILKRLRREAPNARLRLLSFSAGDFEMLETDSVDFILTAFPCLNPNYRRRLLYANEFACVMNSRLADRIRDDFDLERFVSLPHGLVSFEQQGEGQVDEALRAQGLTRRVAIRVPGFLHVPRVCATGDAIFTLPTRAARIFPRTPKLDWLPLPLPLEPTKTFLFWHPRNHLNPLHRWFREIVFDCAARIEEELGLR
jgi:DNA-binding transcriptional LysR family regulator